MSTELTDMQAAFALEYVTNGGDPEKAAIAAGYSERTARVQAYAILATSKVQAEIGGLLMKMRGRSGAIGWNVMIDVAKNPNAPASARVAAARSLMEHAGMIGTAKDVEIARGAADREAPPNYEAVLASIRTAMQPAEARSNA